MEEQNKAPVQIRMRVMNDDDFLSPYWDDAPLLSGDVSDFLDSAVSAVHLRDLPDLQVLIRSNVIDAGEKELYIQAIHNTYDQQLVSLMRQNKRNFQSAFWMLIIGVAILICNVSLTLAGNRPVLAEVFDTIATVNIWTSVDTFWFQRYDIHQQEKRVYALSRVPVIFEDLPDKE